MKIAVPATTITSLNATIDVLLSMQDHAKEFSSPNEQKALFDKALSALSRKRDALAKAVSRASPRTPRGTSPAIAPILEGQRWSPTDNPADALRVITWVGCQDVTFQEVRRRAIVTRTATKQDFNNWARRFGARPVH